jgi:O-antigen biosynthesis protein WbqP
MKRGLDVILAFASLMVLALPMAVIALLVKATSRGPVLHWSDRIGRNNRIFAMPKFRTMKAAAPQVATHLLMDARAWITPVGLVLRATSLDELPQLWCILRGQMSFVGPRPALFNQDDLVELRSAAGVHRLVPGLTGWAQINGRDELSIPDKVALDAYYFEHQSLVFDLKILLLTFVRVLRREGIAQAGEERREMPAESPARRKAA